MAEPEQAELRPVRMGNMAVDVDRRPDGTVYLRSREELKDHARSIVDMLDHWAGVAPDRVVFADRGPDGEWRRVTYAQARDHSRAIGSYLLSLGLSAERPAAILSGNSIEHALVALGAMRAGVPYAPVSPAYSLLSSDHAKLKYLFELITPGFVFAADGAQFEPALGAVVRDGMRVAVARNPAPERAADSFASMLETEAGEDVDRAHGAVTPDSIAKFLFTSGSTGMPKAVVNTQRMLCSNQVMIASALAFLTDEPPVLVDWLPWNHTAGGNHNFGIVLQNGGTMYIDDGTPTPAGIAKTVRNLLDVAPTLYFSVPKGYEMLTHQMRGNDELCRVFFSRLQLLQYAGAGLSAHVWDALESLALRTTGRRVMIITGYGSTETAPFAATTTWPVRRPGEIGLPGRGLEMKLVPGAGKMELRLRGPSITPGYWRQPEKTAESFDEEGFYKIGDALKFVDDAAPEKGLMFDGRVAEDFKLSTGTWVNVGQLRTALVGALSPYVRDAVITGADLDHVGALLLMDLDAVRSIPGVPAGASEGELAHHPNVVAAICERLDAFAAQATGSSMRVARAIILDEPPSIDSGEVTDKGSINQRAVIARRAGLVEDLYRNPSPAHVLVAGAPRK